MKTEFTEELLQYAKQMAKAVHPVLQALSEKTATHTNAHMQITQDQGQFMALLAKIIQARKYLEVGVFTGYSTLAVTLAMADGSQTFALDIDCIAMEIAKEYWGIAKVLHKITPILGDAVISLAKLIDEGHSNTFDMAFIDANKSDYLGYFNSCYSLIRPGGLVLIDNIFMHGEVLNTQASKSGRDMDTFNRFLKSLEVDYCITTIADGLTIVRKS